MKPALSIRDQEFENFVLDYVKLALFPYFRQHVKKFHLYEMPMFPHPPPVWAHWPFPLSPSRTVLQSPQHRHHSPFWCSWELLQKTNGTWKCFLESDHILLTLNLHNLGTQPQNWLLAHSTERIILLQPTLYMGRSAKGLKLGLSPPLLLFKALILNLISKVQLTVESQSQLIKYWCSGLVAGQTYQPKI